MAELSTKFKYEVQSSRFKDGRFVGSIKYQEFDNGYSQPATFTYISPEVSVPLNADGELEVAKVADTNPESGSWMIKLQNGILTEKKRQEKAAANKEAVTNLLVAINSLADENSSSSSYSGE